MNLLKIAAIAALALVSCSEPCDDSVRLRGLKIALNQNQLRESQFVLKLTEPLDSADRAVTLRQIEMLNIQEANIIKAIGELRLSSDCLN